MTAPGMRTNSTCLRANDRSISRSACNVFRFSYGISDLPNRGYYVHRNRKSAILRLGLVRSASRDDSTLPQLMLSSEAAFYVL